MFQRREYLSLASAAVPAAATLALASATFAQRSESKSCTPGAAAFKSRIAAPTDVLYKTAHGQPNGLALTKTTGELWVIDQGIGRWVTLTRLADGSVIREF
jgi:hypothetical protein